MRIAINTRFLLPNKMEGFGRITFEVCRRMVRDHPEDDFIFLFDRKIDPRFVFGPNVTPVILYPQSRHPFLWYLWFEWAIPRALKKYQVDVFFSPDGYLSLRTRVKTLLMCHDLAFIHFPEQIPFLVRTYYAYFTPLFLRRADRLITLSEFSRQEIAGHYNLDLSRFDLTRAASHGYFKPISDQERGRVQERFSNGCAYFLYVGAIHPRKNVHRLIRAFDQFKEATGSTMKLLLVGRFLFKKGEVMKCYNDSKFKEDIYFLGYLDTALFDVTAAAYAVTYVSVFEGFGMPLVEAMDCHVPVITSNVSSMPEVAGNAGLLVDPFSIESISKAMIRIVEDEGLYRQLKNHCELRKQMFNWDEVASEIYESLVKTARNP
ncbi:MAG: glycosyltransferase family 4 protein [Saprospiraceae bacterium]|nr:glycosyltransferase family 4 protein [Saprospiraceae bacterium]